MPPFSFPAFVPATAIYNSSRDAIECESFSLLFWTPIVAETAETRGSAVAGELGAKPERVTSTELLRNKPELIIVHEGREYRLRVTQNGKLILTA
jgi:hemin uptake protein HemP